MSKQKLLMARTLIEQKRYDAARKLLLTIDHPTAKKWLVQLDRIAPVTNEPKQTKQQKPAITPTKARQKNRAKTAKKQATKSTSQPATSRRAVWLIGLITTILGFAVGLALGINIAPTDETLIRPRDLTEQAILDINNTREAQVIEATAKAQITPTPSDLELTATAITDLNATTIAIIADLEATGTALHQPTETIAPEETESPGFLIPATEEATPTFSPDSDNPFGSSDEVDGSDDLPFDFDDSGPASGDESSNDDSGFPGSDGGPPGDDTDSSGETDSDDFPGTSDPTPTQEG